MNKGLLIKAVTAGALASALLVPSAFAAGSTGYGSSSCQVIYGGGEVCNKNVKFTVDKMVQSPAKGGSFVDNLTLNDAKFSAGQEITYKIVVENTGDSEILNVNVVDMLPKFTTFKGGTANYDNSKRVASYDTGKLAKGKKIEFNLTVKVVDDASLPQNQGITCVTNTVKGTETNGSTAQDTAQACIQKANVAVTPVVYDKVPVKTIPATGPEMFSLLGLIPMGAAGVLLRRKSKV